MKVHTSLSIIHMKNYETSFSLSHLSLPNLEEVPTILGFSLLNSEIYAILRVQQKLNQNQQSPKWTFRVLELHTRASPPSPDLLAEEDEDLGGISSDIQTIQSIFTYLFGLFMFEKTYISFP